MGRRKSSTPKRKKPQAADLMIQNKRFKVSVKTLRDIKKLQNSTNLQIPKSPFVRLISEIFQTLGSFRVTKDSLLCLQEATEMYITQLFEDANKLAGHAKRVTVMPRDLDFAVYFENK